MGKQPGAHEPLPACHRADDRNQPRRTYQCIEPDSARAATKSPALGNSRPSPRRRCGWARAPSTGDALG
ncbi:hypothetical protein [Lysobacter gummosus]|uniref:hypothetical protein n=1 Tax=Lysobacter gummosus TaxID=262324 RepID=UPI0036330391